jgi:hypothetical protein
MLLQELAFPHLRGLSYAPGYGPFALNNYDPPDADIMHSLPSGEGMAPFIQPALEVLNCALNELSASSAVRARLAAECPRLRQLSVWPTSSEGDLLSESDHAATLTVLEDLPASSPLT